MASKFTLILFLISLLLGTSLGEINDQGVNFEYCENNADCLDNRECIEFNASGEVEPCRNTTENCVCFKLSSCEKSDDCDDGERCIESSGSRTCATCRIEFSTASFVDEDPSTCEEAWPGGYNGDRAPCSIRHV